MGIMAIGTSDSLCIKFVMHGRSYALFAVACRTDGVFFRLEQRWKVGVVGQVTDQTITNRNRAVNIWSLDETGMADEA